MRLKFLAGLLGSALPLTALHAQEPKAVPPGTPVTIVVSPAAPAAPDVSISLLKRTGHVTPCKSKCTHTGGGNIDVQQPSPDTLVVTMTGVAVAYGTPLSPGQAGMTFDLTQCFEVSFDKPTVKAAKLTIEGRVIGLLRSSCKGGQAEENGSAAVLAGGTPIVSLGMPGHVVGGGESLSVNDHEGPASVPVSAGPYTFNQVWTVAASMPRTGLSGKAPSVEFAPDPALDPLWISAKEPFHGAAKKDFGYQVTIKVAPEEVKEKKEPEKLPAAKVTKLRDSKPLISSPFGPTLLPVSNPK
jgi:hypothetical protein